MNLDKIWDDFSEIKNEHNNNPNLNLKPKQFQKRTCKQCNKDNLIKTSSEIVCSDCGLVQEDNLLEYGYINNESDFANLQRSKLKTNSNFSRIQKMQEWYMWSNEEKFYYKLKCYTIELCKRLEIPELLCSRITSTVLDVMNVIRKYDGTKRGKVKDGIILTCINYELRKAVFDTSLSKQKSLELDSMRKIIGVETKYITKAENMIIEFINNKKLNLVKEYILKTKTPFQYILDVIKIHNINVSKTLLTKVKILIELCEKNDLLLDHTPLSIGVSCFYYILKTNNFSIDLKIFSELYDLSIVTIIKTFNKLKSNSTFIENNLQTCEN